MKYNPFARPPIGTRNSSVEENLLLRTTDPAVLIIRHSAVPVMAGMLIVS